MHGDKEVSAVKEIKKRESIIFISGQMDRVVTENHVNIPSILLYFSTVPMSIKLIKNTSLSMTIVSQSYRDRKPRLISHQCDINQKDSKSQRDKSTKNTLACFSTNPRNPSESKRNKETGKLYRLSAASY